MTMEFIHSRIHMYDKQMMEFDQRQKNYEYIKKVAEVELAKMTNILEGIVDDEDDDDIPYVMGPIHKVNFEERRIAAKLDDALAKMRYGDAIDET